MTPEQTLKVSAEIKTWPREDQIWWRSLLASHPREALFVGELVLRLGVRPVSP